MPQSYRFANVEVLPVERAIRVDGTPVAVGSRAFQVLLTLLENRHRNVTKDELLDAAWPGLVVEENNLQAQISALRKVLGPKVFATIPGIGYRFSVSVQGAEDTLAEKPAPGIKPRLTNLPAAAETLIGREADVLAVRDLLAEHRLVTIVGPGGLGKTRLAEETARSLEGSFPDGVWWVDLATSTSGEMIAPAIAAAANVKLDSGDPMAALTAAIGRRHMLLVLDNCEYLAADVAAVARTLLAAGPDNRLLVTSQQLLRIPGEMPHALDGLGLPSADEPLESARRSGALQLLERRARAADPRFALTSANVEPAIRLCSRLDGIALAIEMAAARVPLMGLEGIVRKLDERLDLLRNADQAAPPRHKTMRATLEWSYALLSPSQKTVLRNLSIFAGSFRLEAAQEVCGGGELDEWEVLDCLSALIGKSLVKVEQPDPPRYRLLETTRLFGLELLSGLGDMEACARRHGVAMRTLSDELERAYRAEPESAWLSRYKLDYDDFSLAFERALSRKDAELAAPILISLTISDATRGFQFLCGRRKPLALSLVPHAEGVALAKLWTCIGLGAGRMQCPGISIIEATRQEVEAWRRVGDRRRLFNALPRYAAKLAMSGKFEDAEAVLAEAHSLFDPAWPALNRSQYIMWASASAAYGKDLELFKRRIEDSAEFAAQVGFRRLETLVSQARAEWALSSGDIPLALELGRVAIERTRVHGNPFGLANAMATYCDSLLMAGELVQLPALLRDCVPVALRNGIGGWAFDPLALFAARRGLPRHAARLLGFADARYEEIEEIRRPWDARIAATCAAECADVLGARELARLRTAGAGMRQEEALALADEALDAPFQEDSGRIDAAGVNTRVSA